MTAFVVKDFGGMIPKADPRALPDNMAEQAINCDLANGPLDGLPAPALVKDLSAVSGTVRKAYRFPGPVPGTDPDVWLPLPSEFSSVVRSPLANDTLHRIYWTNPPGAGSTLKGGFWNTYARIAAGNTGANAPYNLGFIAPDPSIALSLTTSVPGTLSIIVGRSYLITYIDANGEESSPSLPSPVVDGPGEGIWTVHGLPLTPPANPTGKNYPAVASMRLYRTITSTSTGATFYQVADLAFGAATYVDTIADTVVVDNATLESTSWLPPPAELDGLTVMQGGMLVGFTGNTVHFSAVNRPNAWPAGYDQSLQYQIMGIGVWQQSLVVLTQGFPSTGQGTAPENFVFSQVQVPEPCIARGSIVTDMAGVYYASQNGLVRLSYAGMTNDTLSLLTKTIWLGDYHAASIVACRHRAQYLAINGTGVGFLIDYTEPRMGVMALNTFSDAVCVWNDVYTGDAYIIADKKVYLWDSVDTDALVYRWRSRQFYFPAPQSLGAVQISSATAIGENLPNEGDTPPLDNLDPSLVLPADANAIFRLFVGPEGLTPIYTKKLFRAREIFRLPSGRKVFNWQFEIVSRVPIHSVEIASTMKELTGV